MKKLLIGLIMLATGVVSAEPVKSFEHAVNKVIKSIEKNRLSGLPTECLAFYENTETDEFFEIDVREKHNEKCGGDPDFAPRLFSYRVHKKDGSLCTDDILYAIELNAEDPTDFSCRKID